MTTRSLLPQKLRTRILVLGLLVVVPILALTYANGLKHRSLLAAQVQTDAFRLALLASSGQARIAEGAHQLLAALAQLPEVRRENGLDCSRLFATILGEQNLYANLGASDLNGNVFCSAVPMTGRVNNADRAYFQRAVATGTFAIGDYQIGRITGKPTLNFGYPVRDELGQIRAVVFAAFDLAYFNVLPLELSLPEGSTMGVVDSHGTILARYPDAETWVGQQVPESPLLEVMLVQQEGTAEATGVDGVPRLYGFTLMPGSTDENPVYVSVGIPTAVAYHEADLVVRQNLAAMGLLAILTLAGLWVGSELIVLRGTRALLRATRRVAAGDLTARSGLPSTAGEIGELAQAFDQMAASLDQRREALARAEAQYRTLVENIPSAIYTMGIAQNSTATYVSPQVQDLTGYSQAEWLADPYMWLSQIHADDRQQALDEYMRSYRAGQPFHYEYRVVRRDGGVAWIRDQATVVQDESGSRYLLGVMHDISSRKAAEDALTESERRYRALVEQHPSIVYIYEHGQQKRLSYISPQVETLLGYTPEEWLAQPDLWERCMHPEDRARVMPEVAASDRRGAPLDVTYRIQARDGRLRWFHTLSTVIVDDAGVPLYSMGAMNDITELKESEDAQRRLRVLSEALRDTAESLSRSLRLEEVLDRVLENVHRVLPHDAATIMLIEGNISRVVRARGYAERGLEDMALALRLEVDDTFNLKWMRERGQAIVVPDLSSFPQWVRREPSSWQQSYIGVPIRAKGEVIGFLNLESTQRGLFREEDAPPLQALADQAGQAIDNARLFEDAERRLDQLQALRAVDTAISSSVDVRLTLKVLLDQVIGQLHADAADVLTLNRHSQVLEFASGSGFLNSAYSRLQIRLGAGPAGKVALDRKAIAIPDLSAQLGEFSQRGPQFAAEGFVSYFAVPLVAKGRVTGILEVLHRKRFDPPSEWMGFLETLAGQAAIAIDNASLFEDVNRSNLELTLAYDTTLEGWSRALDLRDRETEGHSQRVTDLTMRVARRMGMPDAELVHLRRGALLHDIGKMGIPDSILLKPGPLTDEEWEVMRRHPQYAYDVLSPIAYLRPALDIPYAHHEKWDGSGYPRGWKADAIPLAARIFAVVDVWDALSSNRPYRNAWPPEKVIEHLRQGTGTHFDPEVVRFFMEELEASKAMGIRS